MFKKQEEKLRKSGLKGAPAVIDPGKMWDIQLYSWLNKQPLFSIFSIVVSVFSIAMLYGTK